MIYFCKASKEDLLDSAPHGYSQTAPAIAIVRYGLGWASCFGPSTIGSPQEPFWLVQCDESVRPDLDARCTFVAEAKTEMRASGLLRAWGKTSGLGLARNGGGLPVGLLVPCIAGRSPVSEWLGDEDIDEAPELLDLEP